MPISVVCQKCGKALKVKDEWMGKRATCPGCGNTFIVGAGGVGGVGGATAVKAGKTAFNPAAAQAAKQQREAAHGKFSISPGLVIGGVLLLLLFGGIGAFVAGPKKVNAQWDALGEKPNDDVVSVVSRGLECHFQSMGLYNPRKARNRPEAREVMFYRPTFVMSMPDQVKFKGATTVGPMEGFYNPHSGEIDATVAIGGGIGIPGSGGKKTTGASVNIKGKTLKGGDLETIVNGKPLKLVMPPPSADDEQ
jgi:hypothetical protein